MVGDGGAAGIAVASSLIGRRPDQKIAIIDPVDIHDYQPDWTMVGVGVSMASLIQYGVHWLKSALFA